MSASRPVGLTRDLPAARVMRAQVDGQDMVVWRSASGVLSAWDNRCPHRGMALSHGFVRGEDLACLYHGWHFGCEGGGCHLIPSHPDLTPPETIRTRAFAVAERGGVIWASLGETAEPAAETAEGFDNHQPLRSFEVHASEAAIEHAAGINPFDAAALCLLYNPIQPDRTLVTVLIDARADKACQKRAARWCEAIRREAEA